MKNLVNLTKLIIIFTTIYLLYTFSSFAEPTKVFVKNGNIYLIKDGETIQITNNGKDSAPVLSPDGRQIVFIRQVQAFENNPFGLPPTDAGITMGYWSPYEIWTVYLDEMTPKVLIKSHYNPKNSKENIGWFTNIIFSPDSKKIYFDGFPGTATTYTIHCANRDGTEERWIHYGNLVNIINNKNDPYYGYLLIQKRSPYGAYEEFAVITPEGKEIETFPIDEEDKYIKEFWRKHEK